MFLVMLLLTGIGFFYVHKLSKEAKTILKDNYETLQHSHQMLQALDNFQIAGQTSIIKFEKSLQIQENNITELGERGLTTQLRFQFEEWKKNIEDIQKTSTIKNTIFKIIELNEQAIVRKNLLAEKGAKNALIYLLIISSICLFIVLLFILKFPQYLANPIKELTTSISEIANRNYEKRLNFNSKDEFGELAIAFNTMAAKLDEYEHSNIAQILFEKKRIEAVISTISDPIIGLDEHNTIIFVNQEAIQVLGVEQKNLVGKYAPDIALTNDLLRNLLKELLDENPTQKSELLKIYADEKESYFHKDILEVRAYKTGENKSVSLGHLIVLKNVTPFKELDLAKTNFIATISHELKTPISSIKMSLQLLENKQIGKLNQEQKQLLQHIREDSERLLKIIKELLNMSQIETGNIQLKLQHTSPASIVKYAYDTVIFQANQKKIKIETIFQEPLPMIQADVEKTAWVLINFLSNAIKHSPEDSNIHVNISKSEDNSVVFAVMDTGKGIEEKYLERIFEKYFKIPASLDYDGTGLGLAISKEFIEAQQGKVWAKSTLGEGSQFFFCLPIVA